MTSHDTSKLPELAHFVALETRVWDALVNGDATADAALLTADFLGVYPSGFAGRGDHTGQLADGPVMQTYDLSDTRLLPIGPDHALLCYRATYTRPGSSTPEVMYISSLWVRVGSRWMNSFSQDTPAT